MQTYSDSPESKARFFRLLGERVFVFFPGNSPDPWFEKAWETFGLNHGEHVVNLAMQYLETSFNRQKVVESFQAARQYAFRKLADKQKPAPDEGRGLGMTGAINSILGSGRDRHTRAVFVCTRWQLKRKRGKSTEERAIMDAEFERMMANSHAAAFIDEWAPLSADAAAA